MPALTLYDYPLAYNPAKARLALLERGLKFQTKFIDLFNGQSLDPSYIRINRNGTVPTLVVEGGPVLVESKNIIKYVDTVEGPFGGSNVDRAFVSDWIERVDAWDGNLFLEADAQGGAKAVLGTLQSFKLKYAQARLRENPELAEAYQKKIAALQKGDPDPVAVNANNAKLVSLLDTAEQRLRSSKWLAGSAYCMADVLLTVVLWRIEMGNKEKQYIVPRTNVKNYFATVKARPTCKAAFEAANSGLKTAGLLLPALAKVTFSKLLNCY